MWRSKKFIVAVLIAVVLVGSIGGTVIAQNGNGDGEREAQYGALLDRVCEIYEENTGVTIDPQELKDAFAQVRSEMRDEALDNRLQNLVDQGKIIQEEADQYKEWWQSKPDMPLRGTFGHFGSHGFRDGMRWGGGLHFWGKSNLPLCFPFRSE